VRDGQTSYGVSQALFPAKGLLLRGPARKKPRRKDMKKRRKKRRNTKIGKLERTCYCAGSISEACRSRGRVRVFVTALVDHLFWRHVVVVVVAFRCTYARYPCFLVTINTSQSPSLDNRRLWVAHRSWRDILIPSTACTTIPIPAMLLPHFSTFSLITSCKCGSASSSPPLAVNSAI
jgi:hypothetical protein